MKRILLLMASCLVLGCSNGNDGGKQFTLDGVWTLRQMDYPSGGSKTFEETKETLIRLYEGDSVFHQCWMTRTETGLTIRPIEDVRVNMVDKGHGEYIYIEDDDPHPLMVKDAVALVQSEKCFLSFFKRLGTSSWIDHLP